MIDLTKPYTTRNGYEAHVFDMVDGVLYGIIKHQLSEGRWVPICWYPSGECIGIGNSQHDLVNTPEPPTTIKKTLSPLNLFTAWAGGQLDKRPIKLEPQYKFLGRLLLEVEYQVQNNKLIEDSIKVNHTLVKLP